MKLARQQTVEQCRVLKRSNPHEFTALSFHRPIPDPCSAVAIGSFAHLLHVADPLPLVPLLQLADVPTPVQAAAMQDHETSS